MRDSVIILKYTDKDGSKQKVPIIDRANHMWWHFACLLSNDRSLDDKLEKKVSLQWRSTSVSFPDIFMSHFINRKPEHCSNDWHGLLQLLNKVDLPELARAVRNAILNHAAHD